MKFSVTVEDNSGLQELLNDLESKVDEAVAESLTLAKQGILDKTASGTSYTGDKFEKYSERHANARRERGLTLNPNLNFTGAMLGSLTETKVSDGTGKVEVRGEENRFKAHANQGGQAGVPARMFMGITEDVVRELLTKLGNIFK